MTAVQHIRRHAKAAARRPPLVSNTLTETIGRLYAPPAPRDAETGEAEAEQRQTGGLGD